MAQNPFPFGSAKYDEWNYTHGGQSGADIALADAKGALGRADEFAEETGSADIAALEARLAALRSKPDTRGAVRRITEPLSKVGNAALAVGLPAGVVNPVIGTALGVGGGLAALPDYLRRMISPEETEERPGTLETVGTGLAVLPAARASLKALQSLKKGAPAVMGPLGDTATADMLGGRALAYEGGAGARPAGRQAIPAVEKLMETPSFTNLPRGNVSKASTVRKSTAPGGVPRADELRPPTIKPLPAGAEKVIAHMRRGTKPVFDEMKAAGKFGTTAGRSTFESGGEDILERLNSPNLNDLLQPMDPMERLAARSAERFGRRFRRE